MVCDRAAAWRKRVGVWVWLVLAGMVAGVGGTAAAETLVLQGSTTFDSAIMTEHQADVEAASGLTLRVVPNKTSLGLQALLDGKTDMAMTSTALENEVGLLQPGSHGATADRECQEFRVWGKLGRKESSDAPPQTTCHSGCPS